MGSRQRPLISRTAEAVALGRAVESVRPGADRLFDDPLARGFLRPRWRAAVALLRLPGVARVALAVRERQFPGVLGSFVCRTRFIDDCLQEAVREGTSQVVILGAGFDSRAYRIPRIEQVRVFEVDRPQMIDLKRSRLRKMLSVLPAHVTFVAVDFDRERLSEALASSGFQENQQTFFIWEGVTQYLTLEAIESVFDFVARNAHGSRIVFTYIDRGVIDGSRRRETDQRVLAFVERLGEPWITGFDPAEITQWLSKRGLSVVAHLGASDYRERYLRPAGREMTLYEQERLVVAEVVMERTESRPAPQP